MSVLLACRSSNISAGKIPIFCLCNRGAAAGVTLPFPYFDHEIIFSLDLDSVFDFHSIFTINHDFLFSYFEVFILFRSLDHLDLKYRMQSYLFEIVLTFNLEHLWIVWSSWPQILNVSLQPPDHVNLASWLSYFDLQIISLLTLESLSPA